MNAERIIAGAGCFCWIAGLAVFFIGTFMDGQTKEWMTVIGNIVFFIGLGIVGVLWAKKKFGEKEKEEKDEKNGNAPSEDGSKGTNE